VETATPYPEPLAEEPDESPTQRVIEGIRTALAADSLELPTLPEAPLRVWAVLEREDTETADLVAAIESDPALAARLLRVANSVVYAGAHPVANLRDTVVRVGRLGVRRVVLAVMLGQLFSSRGHPLEALLEEAWRRSTLVASLARRLAGRVAGVDEGVALLAGLVHDVGALPVIGYAEQHPALVAEPGEVARVVARMRRPVGALVAERWRFPDPLRDVIVHLDDPEAAAPHGRGCVQVVYAARALAELAATGALVEGEDGVGNVTLLSEPYTVAEARTLAEQGEADARMLRAALDEAPAAMT
jgi:HD-like signal output (HDOD) protein